MGFLKMNVPLEEAEKCVNKVKERNMGYLFANMEKMDIQEERRKTAEAQKKAEEAEAKFEEVKKWAKEVESRAKEVESRAEEAENRAEEAENRARETENRAEEACNEAIKNTILLCRKFGASKDRAVQEIMDLYGVDPADAQKKVALYWDC